MSSKYSHNVIKTTTIGEKFKGEVPVDNIRREPKNK